MVKKLKAAIFTFTSCFGCSFELLNMKNELLKLFDKLEFLKFNLIGRNEYSKHYDIAFIEGSISTKKEQKRLEEIREKAKFVIALGSCACNGGVNIVKNYRKNAEKEVYGENIFESRNVKPLDEFIRVDYFVNGCPFSHQELLEVIDAIINNKIFQPKTSSVCSECKLKLKGECLLTKGEICLGPITRAGCNAICTSNKRPCHGCRGLAPDANISAYIKMLKLKFKLSDEEIKKLLEPYGFLEHLEVKNNGNKDR